jgi:hypothetical protein
MQHRRGYCSRYGRDEVTERKNTAPTLAELEALRAQGLGWEAIAAKLGYNSRDSARKRYQRLACINRDREEEASRASYAYLRDKDPRQVRWQELNAATGISRPRALAILGTLRREYRLAEDEASPPPPIWRDNGLGESIAYQRALERVERYVAAGDDRSAAINQAYMETGVKVR